jgi:hypothetical protein
LSFQVLVEKMGLPEVSDTGSSSGHGDPLRMYLIFEYFIVSFFVTLLVTCF